jgi:phasin family protein
LEKAFSRHSLADAGFVKAASLGHRERQTPGDAMSTDPMQKFGKESMDMAMKAFGVWTKNTQAIASEVADYSKKSFEDSAAAFQKLVGAKSLEKAMEVQTEYLQSSYEELVAETAKIGELYADLAREAYRPFESVLMKMPGVGAK